MAKKKVVVKKLIIDVDENGDYKTGIVQYGLKYGSVLSPKSFTMGTPGWFDAADLKKILKKTKKQIELGEQIVP